MVTEYNFSWVYIDPKKNFSTFNNGEFGFLKEGVIF